MAFAKRQAPATGHPGHHGRPRPKIRAGPPETGRTDERQGPWVREPSSVTEDVLDDRAPQGDRPYGGGTACSPEEVELARRVHAARAPHVGYAVKMRLGAQRPHGPTLRPGAAAPGDGEEAERASPAGERPRPPREQRPGDERRVSVPSSRHQRDGTAGSRAGRGSGAGSAGAGTASGNGIQSGSTSTIRTGSPHVHVVHLRPSKRHVLGRGWKRGGRNKGQVHGMQMASQCGR
jgi:hypothetical protein